MASPCDVPLQVPDLVLQVPQFLPQPVVPVLVVDLAVHHGPALRAPLHVDPSIREPGRARFGLGRPMTLAARSATRYRSSGQTRRVVTPAPAAIRVPCRVAEAGSPHAIRGDVCGCGNKAPPTLS